MKTKNQNLAFLEGKFKSDEILRTEQLVSIKGGNSDLWNLLNALWNATPEGGCYTWTNDGNGNFIETMRFEPGEWQLPQQDPGGGGTTLPPVVVITGPGGHKVEFYSSLNHTQTVYIFGHNSAINYVNTLINGQNGGSLALGLLGLAQTFGGNLGGLANTIGQVFSIFGLTNFAGSSQLSNILQAIQRTSGNVELSVVHVWGNVPGASGYTYTFTCVETGEVLGTFSL